MSSQQSQSAPAIPTRALVLKSMEHTRTRSRIDHAFDSASLDKKTRQRQTRQATSPSSGGNPRNPHPDVAILPGIWVICGTGGLRLQRDGSIFGASGRSTKLTCNILWACMEREGARETIRAGFQQKAWRVQRAQEEAVCISKHKTTQVVCVSKHKTTRPRDRPAGRKAFEL